VPKKEGDVDFYAAMFKAYLFTIAIETPVLLIGLSPRHSIARRLFCGVWLTACTYPFVWLVFPQFFNMQTQRVPYLIVAETFVPIGECAVFWLAFGERSEWGRRSMWQDLIVITLANLASFGIGEWAREMKWISFEVDLPVE
jgi:hypothetical protein